MQDNNLEYDLKDFWEEPIKFPKERYCLHDGCTDCHGTGRKRTGELCVHMISCPCHKCSPYC